MKKNLFSTMLALLTIVAMLVSVGCKNYDDDISEINKKLASVESSLSTVQGQVTTLQSTVSGLQSTVDAVKAQIAACVDEEDIAFLEAQIVILEDAIEDCVAAIAQNQAAIAQNGADIKEGAEYAKSLAATIDALSAAQKALETSVASQFEAVQAAATAAHEALQKTIDSILADIESIKAQLKDYYTKAEIEAMLASFGGSNFSIKAIATTVETGFYEYKWQAPASSEAKKLVEKIAAVYPEVAGYKEGDKISFGTGLPFFVTPSGADMTGYTFSLVDVEGNDYGAKFSAPEKGIASGSWSTATGENDVYMTTKAGNEGAWSVALAEPLYDKDGNVLTPGHLALVATNGEQTAQTSFAYDFTYASADTKQFKVTPNTDIEVKYDAAGINISKTGLFTFTGAPLFYAVYESADTKAQIERYNIKVENGTLTMDEFEVPSVSVKIKVTAIGINGVPAEVTGTLTVKHIAEEYPIVFSDNAATLASKSGEPVDDILMKWNVSELGMSVSELSAFIKFIDDNKDNFKGEIKNSKDETLDWSVCKNWFTQTSFLDKNGEELTSGTYDEKAEKAVYFGCYVKSSTAVPGTYALTFSLSNEYQTVKYKTNVTIKNPEADQIKLIDALCKDGVLVVIGNADGEEITYRLADAFITADNGATSATGAIFEDAEKAESEFPREVTSWVDKYQSNLLIPANSEYLYKNHKFTVTYYAFGNKENTRTLAFEAMVVSPCYTEDATKVTVADQTIFFKKTKTEENSFSIDKIYKSAVYAAGTNAGKSYKFYNTWKKTGGVTTDVNFVIWDNNGMWLAQDGNYTNEAPAAYKGVTNHNNVSEQDDNQYVGNETVFGYWMLSENDEFIEIDLATIPTATLQGFGFNATQAADMKSSGDDLFLTEDMVKIAFEGWRKYYETTGKKSPSAGEVAAEDVNKIAAYEYVKKYFTYKVDEETSSANYTLEKVASDALASVILTFDDVKLAEKILDVNTTECGYTLQGGIDALYSGGFSGGMDSSWDPTAYVSVKSNVYPSELGITDKVVFTAKVKITDNWGMTMTKPLNVTVSVNK